MAAEKLKIMFVAIDAVGHFNAFFGIAAELKNRGHSVTFAAPPTWKSKLMAMGYNVEVYTTSDEPVNPDEKTGEIWCNMISNYVSVLTLPPIELHKKFYLDMWQTMKGHCIYAHDQFKAIVSRVKPDVLLLDFLCPDPALIDSGIPWISGISNTPLGISRENVPPAYTGYPTNGDREEWKKWDEEITKLYEPLNVEFSEWLKSKGCDFKFTFPHMGLKHSPYANIYMYPQELDYTPFRPNPPKHYQFDNFLREESETFEVPEKLRSGPGKLVYFSMGTIGCAELGLLRKLISILAKSPHRFIVSKGIRGDDLELADNMWGKNNVPQLSILPLVDLVITHGGNNTITEAFHYGKRVLALPFMYDQWDNAQRIEETGLGLKFLPYDVAEDELLAGIELLLGDELLERRMVSISQRIQSKNNRANAADLVESIAREHQNVQFTRKIVSQDAVEQGLSYAL